MANVPYHPKGVGEEAKVKMSMTSEGIEGEAKAMEVAKGKAKAKKPMSLIEQAAYDLTKKEQQAPETMTEREKLLAKGTKFSRAMLLRMRHEEEGDVDLEIYDPTGSPCVATEVCDLVEELYEEVQEGAFYNIIAESKEIITYLKKKSGESSEKN